MKAKKQLNDSNLFSQFHPIRDALRDFVSYLDIPEYRKKLLEGWLALQASGLQEFENGTADAILWQLRDRLSDAFDVAESLIQTDATINDAIYKLVLNISTREDRIVACRQIGRFPMQLALSDSPDPALDGNALYVALEVHFALDALTRRMSELAEENNSKKGE